MRIHVGLPQIANADSYPQPLTSQVELRAVAAAGSLACCGSAGRPAPCHFGPYLGFFGAYAGFCRPFLVTFGHQMGASKPCGARRRPPPAPSKRPPETEVLACQTDAPENGFVFSKRPFSTSCRSACGRRQDEHAIKERQTPRPWTRADVRTGGEVLQPVKGIGPVPADTWQASVSRRRGSAAPANARGCFTPADGSLSLGHHTRSAKGVCPVWAHSASVVCRFFVTARSGLSGRPGPLSATSV